MRTAFESRLYVNTEVYTKQRKSPFFHPYELHKSDQAGSWHSVGRVTELSAIERGSESTFQIDWWSERRRKKVSLSLCRPGSKFLHFRTVKLKNPCVPRTAKLKKCTFFQDPPPPPSASSPATTRATATAPTGPSATWRGTCAPASRTSQSLTPGTATRVRAKYS